MESLFVAYHDQCLQGWDRAVQSGQTGELAQYPSSDYQGFFGYNGVRNVTATSRDDAVRGLEQLLSYVVGSQHVALHRVIKMRSHGEVVVSYERNIFRDNSLKMAFLVLQTWRIEDAEWKLVREFAENI